MATTPNLGLRYPLDTDPAKNGALNIQELAEDVDYSFTEPGYLNPNTIANPDFYVWERNRDITTGTASFNSQIPDLWRFDKPTSQNYRLTRQTAGLPENFAASVKIENLVAVAAGESLLVGTVSYPTALPIVRLSSAKLAVSFWAKSSATGTYTASIRRSEGVDTTFSQTYEITSANTWQYVELLYENLGSGFQPALNQFGWLWLHIPSGTLGQTFEFTGVRVMVSYLSRYTQPNRALELIRSQQENAILAATAIGTQFGNGYSTTTTSAFVLVPFRFVMNTLPALQISAAAHFRLRHGTTTTACTGITLTTAYNWQSLITCSVAAGLTAGRPVILEAANADARLEFA